MSIASDINSIKKVLAGDTIIDITYDQGVGRLDRNPVLQPDTPANENIYYPQFFEGDGMSREPSNKDPIEELK